MSESVVYHGLDSSECVYFYEPEFYCLSNFSAFVVCWAGNVFPTSEHAYQWAKFPSDPLKQNAIRHAKSAHDAFKMAERWKKYRRDDWDAINIPTMRCILWAKAHQHEYVRRKLLQSTGRQLIENSWRDGFWGWGPNHDGRNELGKLWMEIRTELPTADLNPQTLELPKSLQDAIAVLDHSRELLKQWGPTPVTDLALRIDQVLKEVEDLTQDRTDPFWAGVSMACEEIKCRLERR